MTQLGPAADVSPAGRTPAMALTNGGVVLVVEDDDSMREAMGRLLNAAGFEAVAYGSAEALLATGGGAGAVCVVSDFKLPAMSGLELLSELVARGSWPPVILVTAHDSPQLRDEAGRRGAAAYLAKPFAGSALLAAIRSVAGRPAPTRGLAHDDGLQSFQGEFPTHR